MISLGLAIFFSLFMGTYCDTEFKCFENFCKEFHEKNKCPELSEECKVMNATHNGVWMRYPGTCNCCNYCLTNIRAGEDCVQGLPGMQTPTEICGPGLSCTMNTNNSTATCQRMKTPCTKSQDDYDQRRADGTLGMMEVRAKCDDDGLFSPFHCIPGMICYCVSPDGERIFGETPFLDSWDEQKMTCGCSLNYWKAMNSLDPKYLENEIVPVLGARCNEYGEFDPLQCMTGSAADCFCVDPVTGRPNDAIEPVSVPNLKKNNPSCFDPKRHKAGTYVTECEIMRSSFFNNQTTFFANPICQPDGMFHRVQTLGTRKICVNPSGKQIIHNGIEYSVDVESQESVEINCNCARNFWLLSQAGVREFPKCDSSGNFQSWQCRRNECFCVDKNGDQCGSEVPIEDVEELSCYSKKLSDCTKY